MIVLEDVHKRYRTHNGPGKWVLTGISLTIPKQCNVGLMGANGAGKTTLLRLIGAGSTSRARGGSGGSAGSPGPWGSRVGNTGR